jgi:hypothetical protein
VRRRRNGYFAEGVFNALGDHEGNATKSGQEKNYQYDLEIVPDIYTLFK